MLYQDKTMTELRDEYITRAKKAEVRASLIAQKIHRRAFIEMKTRYPRLSDAELNARARDVSLEWRSKDPLWKAAVGENQWFISQATMFGVAALGDRLTALGDLLNTLSQAQDVPVNQSFGSTQP